MKKINEELNSNEIEKVISKKNEKHALKEKSESSGERTTRDINRCKFIKKNLRKV